MKTALFLLTETILICYNNVKVSEKECNMFKVSEVANLLKVHRNTIFKALQRGRIKGIKIGGVWRISEEEVERIKQEGF